MKSKIILSSVVLIALLSIVWYGRSRAPAQTELILHGNVDIREVELAFNANGRISDILFRDGDHVKAGQLLATLDTGRLRLTLAQAEAQTAVQREALARYRAGSRPEEIRQARALREAARLSVEDADAYHQRQLSLAARHFVSQQQVDSAGFALDKARQQLKAADQTLRLAELGPRREDVAAARAALAVSEAAAEVIRRDIRDGELRALSDGVIENRILEIGDIATPSKPVFTLALTEPVWVRAYLPEAMLGRVPQGALAWVHTDSQPEKRYRGWVGYVSPGAEFTPKSVETEEVRASLVYQVRVFLCEGQLRMGMPATVTIRLDQSVSSKAESCREGN